MDQKDHKAKKEESAAGDGKVSTKLEKQPHAPEAGMKADEIEQLKAQAAQGREYWDRLLRLTADFDNYKKRSTRAREEGISFANENLMGKLLPVMDAFEMALASATTDSQAKSLQAGIVMISNQLKSVLTEAGLEEIDANDKPFDPNFHEAISQQESADAPEGQILRQVRKGYKFRNRLIRPAGVIVARKPSV